MPNGRCRMHGGPCVGNGKIKDGRQSKYLPARLRDRYAEKLRDENLSSVADEIAIVDTRLSELFESLDEVASPAEWKTVTALWRKAVDSGAGLSVLSRAELESLDRVLTSGPADWGVWSEIMLLIEQRRRLAESETKRLAHLQQFITAQQANVLMAAIIHSIHTHVTDADTRCRLAIELAHLLDRPAPGNLMGERPAAAPSVPALPE